MPRLAILLCDSPPASVLAEEGDYHAIFSNLMRGANPGVDFGFDAYDVKNKLEYPSDDIHYDAMFLSGSASSAYDDLEWINKLVAYIAKISATKPECKLFGICFGHQIIARALGGECVPNNGKWEVGVSEVELTALGQQIFGRQILNIQQMHRDHVPAVPAGLQLLGSNPTTFNQGMVKFKPGPEGKLASLTDIQIITVQGHPEFTKSIVQKIVTIRTQSGVISSELAEDVERRSEWRNDGLSVIALVFWRILGFDMS